MLKDQRSDLAVLRIKGAKERFPTLQFANSDDLQVGDVVLAIGDPFGVGQTVTHGIVSAVARTDVGISDYQFFIQTDAAINPGNSGGPLVDMNGRMVGINSAIYSRSGGSQGIGFAIPANMVRVVVASAEGGSGAVKRPWLGAKLQEVTPDIADSLGLQRPSGALVASVVADSPAAHAGIKTGDVIVSVDGTEVDDPNAFNYRFATKPLGGSAQLGVMRQGHAIVVPVALQSLPDTPREEVEISAASPFLGATVANLSPALADEMRLDPQSARRRHHRRGRRLGGAIDRLSEGRHHRFRQQPEDRKARRSRTRRQDRQPAVAHHHHARRPADLRHVFRMSSTAPSKRAPSLFAAARPRARCAAAARRQAPARTARRRGRPGSSARPRRRAHPHAGDPLARLADLLGAARHRQDHGGAACWRTRPNFISSRFRRFSPASPT